MNENNLSNSVFDLIWGMLVLSVIVFMMVIATGCATTSTTTSSNEPAYDSQEFRMLMLQANPHLPPVPAWVD